jgi:hypothetical protein
VGYAVVTVPLCGVDGAAKAVGNDAFPFQCFELICYQIDRSWAGTMCDAIPVLEVVATVETESMG